jgi:hypothetical protein
MFLFQNICEKCVLLCVTDLSKYEEYRQNSDVSKEVGKHNTHHGEKRQHTSQQTTDHSRKRLK